MSDNLTDRLAQAFKGESTADQLASLRISIRTDGRITFHALHNAVTEALERAAAEKLANEATQ